MCRSQSHLSISIVSKTMSNSVNLSLRTLLVVSGASRGIGRALAVECSAKLASGSLVILLARSKSGLEETQNQILASSATNITVIVHAIDLTRPSPDDLAGIFRTALDGRSIAEFALAMIINNVGTIGPVNKSAWELGLDAAAWQDYFAINVFSVAGLNSAFLNTVGQPNTQKRVVVVNITSGTAIDPYPSFAFYW